MEIAVHFLSLPQNVPLVYIKLLIFTLHPLLPAQDSKQPYIDMYANLLFPRQRPPLCTAIQPRPLLPNPLPAFFQPPSPLKDATERI